MKRTFFAILFLLLGSLSVASPARACSGEFDSEKKVEKVSEKSAAADRMVEAAQIAEMSAFKRSHRHCWRAVKDAMMEAEVLPFRPTTKYAKQAGEELEEKFGFKKIAVSDPFDAPIGAVLVYGGRGAGHVEIRTFDGFVSDVLSERPSHRPLIGVYVKA